MELSVDDNAQKIKNKKSVSKGRIKKLFSKIKSRYNKKIIKKT